MFLIYNYPKSCSRLGNALMLFYLGHIIMIHNNSICTINDRKPTIEIAQTTFPSIPEP